MIIGLLRETKSPPDNRVALTPAHCRWLQSQGIRVVVQPSPFRCYKDGEYRRGGIEVREDLSGCDLLLGIKEVAVDALLPGKTYVFFSHTRKQQPYNRRLLQTIIEKRITLIDYECMEHEDGQRILGFGFFAGIVGAHNGVMAYGQRTGAFTLGRVFKHRSLKSLIHTYFGLKLPNIKIALTGSGRVAHGLAEIMNLMGVIEVEPEEFKAREFTYPVYVQLKGAHLYAHRENGGYTRTEFHEHPDRYRSRFTEYTSCTDLLLNGVYWEPSVPRLFEREDVQDPSFRISVIADVTDDAGGSVPINLGDATISEPVYGVDRTTFQKTEPRLPNSIDIMAVGNLPNELPREASRYFGEQLLKHLPSSEWETFAKATIVREGALTERFAYLSAYAGKD